MTRLRKWVKGLITDPTTPRTILLVGGPGNGKTDAIESCIEFIDTELGAKGALYDSFAKHYDVQLPPRRVTIDLSSIGVAIPAHLRGSISLIQDATEGDPASGSRAEALLLEELTERLDPKQPGIYLCCVNRGILAHASTLVEERNNADPNDGISTLLSHITAAVTSGPNASSCWPLAGFESCAVWPMDIESLVDPNIVADGDTVAHQIFRSALDQSKWGEGCPSGRRCPFCRNRELLSKGATLNALIRLLRFHELASGKRWTFRDLFSLVPYLLVGDYADFQIRNKPASPCEWAANQNELAKSNRLDDQARGRALYLLASRLYFHRLFPRWPSLNRGEYRRFKAVLESATFSKGVDRARDLFRYLVYDSGREARGEIQSIVCGSLSDFLDAALAPGSSELLKKGEKLYSVSSIEELFSLSVREGFDVTKSGLEPLEQDLLSTLVEADEALVEENFPRNNAHQVMVLQASLRQFCSRLVKRSLGSRRAICKDVETFESYERATHDARDLLDVRKQMKKLLHDDKNRFRASLVTTFGQPIAQRSRDIVLLTQSVQVREPKVRVIDGRPPESLPYVMVDKHFVPITFPLYKALREVIAGLHDASLPAEIFALISGVKALVSGHVVRDAALLEEDSIIELGNTGQTIEIAGGHFRFVESRRI